MSERLTKQDIADWRGVPNEKIECFSCQKLKTLDELEPEEGGVWWCHDCIKIWEDKNDCYFADGQPRKPPGKAE